MQIYELKPTDAPSIHWEGSYHRGQVIVRAADESEARATAAVAFDKMVDVRDKSRDSPESPWWNAALVSCNPVEDSEYEVQGTAQLLFPDPIG